MAGIVGAGFTASSRSTRTLNVAGVISAELFVAFGAAAAMPFAGWVCE